MLLHLLSILPFVTAVTAGTWTTNSTVGMPANTTSGIVVGHPNVKYPYVSEYLGIPFAKPPTGERRFMPPKPYVSNGSIIIAASQPPSCPQARPVANYSLPPNFVDITLDTGSFANHTSEDCLFMDIWTKYPLPGAKLKPVLVWFYGGGFHAGGTRDDAEQGALFSEQEDVVTVNLNYRLGVFGFPGAPNITQNLGLLDQRMAVEWVRDNIQNFGGDPEKIVIYGHSKGGQSVDYYNYVWLDDPIISGSIPMSSSAFSAGGNPPNISAAIWDATAQAVGCPNSTTSSNAAVLACMRTIEPEKFISVVPAVKKAVAPILRPVTAAYDNSAGPYAPTQDNITVFSNYTLRAQQRKFIQKPILTGSNDDEMCLFAERGAVPVSDQNILTTYLYTCRVYEASQVRLNAGVPVWKYRFFGAYPNTYANVCPGRGWHGLEVYVLFGSTRTVTGFNATHKENDMGWWMRNAWAAFAHNPQSGLLDAVGWPSLTSNQSAVMVLGLNTTLATLEASVWDGPCTSGAALST